MSYLTHTCTHNRACARTQVLGQPHSNTLEELIRECQKLKDALDDFEAWNSGRNVTNSSKELDFVMDPFEPSEGWQEQDPEDWKPKHEYGGNRIPIRLQVLSVCHNEEEGTCCQPSFLHPVRLDFMRVHPVLIKRVGCS